MDILNPEEDFIYQPDKCYQQYHILLINLLHNPNKIKSFFKAFKNSYAGKNIYNNLSDINKLAFDIILNKNGIGGLIYILKKGNKNYEKISIMFDDIFKILKLCFNFQFPNLITL